MLRASLLLTTGVVLGIGVIVACSDDAPGDVDAQVVCDCPPAEPPLEGRIVRQAAITTPLDPLETSAINQSCPAGGILLGGSCTNQNNERIQLMESGFGINEQEWICRWDNTTDTADVGELQTVCLMPPEQ
jgi:hypothetical protein